MGWIKRNLFFFIGSITAVVLMGLAGWYLYSKWELNNQVFSSLNDDTEKLRRLSTQNPHPGNAKIDNIKAARDQQQELRAYIEKTRAYFQRIAPIPDEPKITDMAFATALSRTISQLQRDATNSSVTLLPSANTFSFGAQLNAISFAAGSLHPLAVQLGEIKTICDVLFDAKINSLERIQRERVSADDANGSQSDYLIDKTTTNGLAVITPYQLTFNCFSTELAAVLAGFAGSPHGLIVKNFNVEPAPATPADMTPAAQAEPARYVPQPVAPVRPSAADMDMAMKQRYGLLNRGSPGNRYGGGGQQNQGGIPYRPMGASAEYPTGVAPTPGAVPPGTVPGRPLSTVLDEHLLRITMNLLVVKLNPPK